MKQKIMGRSKCDDISIMEKAWHDQLSKERSEPKLI